MQVVIGGASGFLGTHLGRHLEGRGHTVTRLVRRRPTSPDESRWDTTSGEVDPQVIERADVVVNLAGAPTVGNPHSQKWAHNLRESRVRSTATLAAAIAGSERRPAFLAGNGISVYGDHGSAPLTESADTHGDAMLTEVALAWEAAAQPAREPGSASSARLRSWTTGASRSRAFGSCSSSGSAEGWATARSTSR
jgi:NAD dependent epimerase/dehydratase family enzyme